MDSIFNFLSQFSYLAKFLNRNVFQKYYALPIMPLFIGEKCVSSATEFKLLRLLRPVLKNVLVSCQEIRGDPLEKTASNRQVCLWYSFLLNGGAEVDLQESSEKYLL